MIGILHLAAEHVTHQLLAVANPQHRHAQRKDSRINGRRTLGCHAGRTARQDDGFRAEVVKKGLIDAETGVNFAVDSGFANAPRDQLGHLRAEVDDKDFFGDGKGGDHRV